MLLYHRCIKGIKVIFYQKIDSNNFLYNNQIVQKLPSGPRATWFYDSTESGFYVEAIANAKVEDYLPFSMELRWLDSHKKMQAHKKALKVCRINNGDLCYMIPKDLIVEYYSLLNAATENYVKKNKINSFHAHLSSVASLLEKIKEQKINLDFRNVPTSILENSRNRKMISKIENNPRHVSYDLKGSRTGRLTTRPNSIPILTLKKELRGIIKPTNDIFAEFDFNAAEARVLLALGGNEQPTEDIHNWNIKHIFSGKGTRSEAKQRFFAWLYNPESTDRLLDEHYDKSRVLKDSYNGKQIETVFKRKIESDDFHALNYLIQSTCADLVLEQAVKLNNFLKGKNSRIAFIVHDSIVVDVSKKDLNMMTDMLSCFSETRLGRFKVNLSGGKDFGNMKTI